MAHGIKVKIQESHTTGKPIDVSYYRVFLTPQVFIDKLRGYRLRFAKWSSQYDFESHYSQISDGTWVVYTTTPEDTEKMVELLESLTKVSEEELDNLKKYAGGLVKITGFHTRIYFDSKKLETKEDWFVEMPTCPRGDIFIDLTAGVLISTNRRKDTTKVKEILDTIKAGKVDALVE